MQPRLSEELSHSEIQELLGAYALDAVDEQERATIEAHLESCESCPVELEDHRRLAETMLRHASRVSPLASVEANGSAKISGDIHAAPPAHRWRFPVAMAIVLVLFGALLAQGQVRFNELGTRMERVELRQRAQLAATDPAAFVTTLRTPRNEAVLTIVSRVGGGDSYAMNSALPSLAKGDVYQLWAVGNGGGETAVATLGQRVDAVEFSLPSDINGVLVTVEKAPAPSRPTLPPIAGARW